MARYFKVLRDYQSAQRPSIGHGYKAGQILRGSNVGEGSVDLRGATTADEVFGRAPSEVTLSATYGQTLSLEDVAEVFPIADWRELKTGVSYQADRDIRSNIGYIIKAGDVFLCADSCHDDSAGMYEEHGQYPQFSIKGTNQYYTEKGNAGVKIYALEQVDTEPTKGYDVKQVVAAKVEGGVALKADVKPQKRTKPIYEVQLADGTSVLRTKDRDRARRMKATLGGKEKGVTIQQYNHTKEIR